MNWLIPWLPIVEKDFAERLAAELRRAVKLGHVLHGISVTPIAARQDCDDVLFELLDGSGRFAVTHLTYAQHPESDSQWPATRLCKDWTQFEHDVMQVDHSDWTSSGL